MDRCVAENDWLRLEIEHAIKLKKNIIPNKIEIRIIPKTRYTGFVIKSIC